MIISAIVAMSRQRVIGKDNQIPWYLPADLKYFKKTTLHHHVIMGRKTFQSIGRPLPKRTNIVLTRDLFFAASSCLVAHSADQALNIAIDNGASEVFIIGGGEIYEMFMPFLDKIYLTEVEIDVMDGTATFPEINPLEWIKTWEEKHEPDDRNPYAFTMSIHERLHGN